MGVAAIVGTEELWRWWMAPAEPPLRLLLAVCAAMAVAGLVDRWVRRG